MFIINWTGTQAHTAQSSLVSSHFLSGGWSLYICRIAQHNCQPQTCIFLFLEMDQCLLLGLLLLMGREGFCQPEEVCTKSVINSCDDCIQSGQFCVWCEELNFTKAGEQEAARCDTRAQLIERGCKNIISPTNNYREDRNDPLSNKFSGQDPIQLKPQKISLTLRPGLPETFTVSFKRLQGYPVDLYYLMDLSYSMKDDLENVKRLGQELFKALRGITENGRIGFGAFVDKTVLPYTNTNKEKLAKPCDENEQFCQAAFGYRHVLNLTSNINDFNSEVSKQYISGNLDSPEGSLDAMMQAAVCAEKIGWRRSSTRLIVLTTDAGFHMAGDGKLAGILEPSDEMCHLESNLYTKSNEMDYPSVGQLAVQLEKNNIQPIFAVTENVAPVYKKLSKLIPKSEVGVLSKDSDNVVQLIQEAYNRLSSRVTLTHDKLPDDVRVVYTPVCDNPVKGRDSEGICDNVPVAKEISFNVTVTATSCLESTKSFTIRPQGIKDTLKVSVSTKCDCECKDPEEQNHPHCTQQGSVNCGTCRCKPGFVGQFCECALGNKDEASPQDRCRKDNGTVCEGRGECVCGRCECHTSESGKFFHGEYCECDDDHCEKFQNKLCGGNGKCNCGTCKCDEGYEGSACQCKKSEEGCRTLNNTVCFGRGNCVCDRCECDEGYQRPRCELCLGCADACKTKLNCIECLGFQSGPFKKNCSESCHKSVFALMVKEFNVTTSAKKECHQKDSEGCWITFRMRQLVGRDNYLAEILEKRECPEPPSVIAIIAGSVAGVFLIGVLLLMLIKFLIYMKDLKEYRKFEEEKRKAKWQDGSNPLFKNATTTVTNPFFTGD